MLLTKYYYYDVIQILKLNRCQNFQWCLVEGHLRLVALRWESGKKHDNIRLDFTFTYNRTSEMWSKAIYWSLFIRLWQTNRYFDIPTFKIHHIVSSCVWITKYQYIWQRRIHSAWYWTNFIRCWRWEGICRIPYTMWTRKRENWLHNWIRTLNILSNNWFRDVARVILTVDDVSIGSTSSTSLGSTAFRCCCWASAIGSRPCERLCLMPAGTAEHSST